MQTLLIIGCGDIARRVAPRLLCRYRIFALLREPEERDFWREQGIHGIVGDLDFAPSLKRFRGLADIVLYFAPPQNSGPADMRMRRVLAMFAQGKKRPHKFVYISTCGVYGNTRGAKIDETARLLPQTSRARRRADAERQLRRFACRSGVHVSILRAPGIYAADRLPLKRLEKKLPALRDEDDVYTSHIHANDLAALVGDALRYGRPNRCYNAVDDSELKMGDYFDCVADRFGLPRAPRIACAEAEKIVSPARFAFMSESRRIDNLRIKTELRARLAFPHVTDGIEAAWRERIL
ncbi:MAG: NAD(P)H-binding protein [Candidatus Accumulibacter sp.]|nr:NAD(P)H-binding protein [Accumulibacter sp.]